MIQLERISDTKMVIRDGATVIVEFDTTSGIRVNSTLQIGTYPISGVVLSSSIAGIGQLYKVARGEVTLDGSNPTPIITGLATVVACTVTMKSAASPSSDPTNFTVDYAGGVTAGNVNLYAWKPTGAALVDLVASTNSAAVISWIAVGT